jgi:thiamine phosphate synthase YjbQ (UPF0047 family)
VTWLGSRARRVAVRHHQTGEDNADAHQAHDHGAPGHGPDHERQAGLGPWEQIFMPSSMGSDARVIVKVMGDGTGASRMYE